MVNAASRQVGAAHAPHPIFAALHAHLIGEPDLAAAGVSAERLLSLYPVALNSYRQFFRDFYAAHRGQPHALYHSEPAFKLSGCLFNVEIAVRLAMRTDAKVDAERDAIFAEEIPRELIDFSDELLAQANAFGVPVRGAYSLIRLQLWPLLKVMWLLAHWQPTAFEQDLREDTKVNFCNGLLELAKFYRLPLDQALLRELPEES